METTDELVYSDEDSSEDPDFEDESEDDDEFQELVDLDEANWEQLGKKKMQRAKTN